MQSAYLIADFERATFSIHQALFPDLGYRENIISIQPKTLNSTIRKSRRQKEHGLKRSLVAAIVVPSFTFLLVVIIVALWWTRTRKSRRAKPPGNHKAPSPEITTSKELNAHSHQLPELSHEAALRKPKLYGEHAPWRSDLMTMGLDQRAELAAGHVGHEDPAEPVAQEIEGATACQLFLSSDAISNHVDPQPAQRSFRQSQYEATPLRNEPKTNLNDSVS